MMSVSGCRGVVGASLTPAVVCRIIGGYCAWLDESEADRDGRRPVVIGRDGRRGGDVVQQTAIAALRAAGRDVIDLDVATTPTVGVMVRHHRAAGGVVITASHNPASWNGVKCLTADGQAPCLSDAEKILSHTQNGDSPLAPCEKLGEINSDGAAAHVHVARVLGALKEVADIEKIRSLGFRVVLDSVNASGAAPGRMLLEALGCEVVQINGETSGVFPHPPEPIEEHLADLKHAVPEAGASVGFAQDPDADRLVVVDERGVFLGEERTLVIAASVVIEAAGKGATVAVNLSTSRMIDELAEGLGATVVRTPVGEANVVAGMERAGERCVIGGEGNGGVIWPCVVRIRDSLGAMALALAAMSSPNRRLASELASLTSDYAIIKRKLPIREGLAEKALTLLGEHYAQERVDRQDGVRIDFDERRAWLHLRASNTEPIMRLIAEAPTSDEAQRLIDDAATLIEAL